MDPIKYFYPLMLVVGIMTSRSDIKIREIRNAHLVFGFSVGAVLYAALVAMNVYRPDFFFFAGNMAVASVLAYGLYLGELWSAGDGKVFILFSFLTVSSPYGHVLLLPCVLLFMNSIFLALCIVLLLDFKFFFLHFGKVRGILLGDLRNKFFISMLIIFSFSWAFWGLAPELKSFSPVLITIILYLAYAGIYRLITIIKRWRILLILLFGSGLALHLIFRAQDLLTASSLLRYLSMTLSYSLLFTVLQGMTLAYKEKNAQKRAIAFAPIVFIGAVTMESPLVFLAWGAFNIIRHRSA